MDHRLLVYLLRCVSDKGLKVEPSMAMLKRMEKNLGRRTRDCPKRQVLDSFHVLVYLAADKKSLSNATRKIALMLSHLCPAGGSSYSKAWL